MVSDSRRIEVVDDRNGTHHYSEQSILSETISDFLPYHRGANLQEEERLGLIQGEINLERPLPTDLVSLYLI